MTFNLISLGCDKTLVDSEHIIGALRSAGFSYIEDISSADLIAINTCCFIHDALEESIQTVIEAGTEKKDDAKIAVFGCMARRFYEETVSELTEIDYVIPSCEPAEIVDALCKELERKPTAPKRFLTGPGYYSYLKISDGCNKNCTYCAIPGIRGRYKSIPKEELLAEASELALMGVKELMIVAQETTLYGVDLYGHKCLHELLSDISKIDEIEWIRLLYAYPEEIYPELIDEIRDNPKLVHYIDMPIQHCNDEILKAMGRRTTKETIVSKIADLRKSIPDICIRTTLITGFPGETKNQHEELLGFIKEQAFDRLGVFTYSEEEGTKAALLDDKIDEDTKEKRLEELMLLQAEITNKSGENLIGKKLKVIVEGRIVEEDVYQGRTYKDAPDIDGLIFFDCENELISGDIVEVTVTDTNGYDLVGKL